MNKGCFRGAGALFFAAALEKTAKMYYNVIDISLSGEVWI